MRNGSRVEIARAAPIATALGCICPECLRLDAQYPSEGFQYALIAPPIAGARKAGPRSK